MASNITLSAGVRSNLLNLQNTGALKDLTQGRLSTGKKVNSALDNPTNFFTAAALSSRSSDLTALLDGISNGIQTLKAADNGIKSITSSIESLQATVRQARQDKSFKNTSSEVDAAAIGTATQKQLQISGGSVGATAVGIDLVTDPGVAAAAATPAQLTGTGATANVDLSGGSDAISFTLNGTSVSINAAKLNAAGGTAGVGTLAQFVDAVNADFSANGGTGVAASVVGGQVQFTSTATGTAANVTVASFASTTSNTTSSGIANGTDAGTNAVVGAAVKTVDQIVDAINGNASLTGKVRASNDNGKLRIENQSNAELTVEGYNSTSGKVDGSTGASAQKVVGGNETRKDLAKQFNEVRDKLNQFSDDASFNGINLLRGDELKLNFNETSTSSITIQSKNKNGVNTTTLGIGAATEDEFGSDAQLDLRLTQLAESLTTLRSQSSAFGSKLSIVQNRQDFTKNLTNTLQVGADNLTLADTNEEGANLLALNTRQQLQTTSLSFASQADQAVLQFLR